MNTSVDFKLFITSLAATAAATMSHVEALLKDEGATAERQSEGQEEESTTSPEEKAERIQGGLASTRQLIDTLTMLEVKTKGNLEQDEQELLQTSLTQLRITYVRLADRSKAAET